MKVDTLISIALSIILIYTIIISAMIILSQLQNSYIELPPPNSTSLWKIILKNSDCKWYQLGCENIACSIDCDEINNYAKEEICICK